MTRLICIVSLFLFVCVLPLSACGDKKEEPAAQKKEPVQVAEPKPVPQQQEPAAEPAAEPPVEERAVPPKLETFQQEITTFGTVPERVAPDELVTFMVRVKNTSDETWFAKGGGRNNLMHRVRLGCQWLTADGNRLPQGGHALLPYDVKPGEAANLEVKIRAPQDPAGYILRISMVNEGVAWFYGKGAKALEIPMAVE